MDGELLLRSDFLFKADLESGFSKLADYQFDSGLSSIVRELLANSLDEQAGGNPGEPVLARYREENGLVVFSITDHGPAGFNSKNLCSMHKIGSSSKRGMKNAIGRFGCGFISVFNGLVGIRKVEITTNLCGRPARITYQVKNGRRIPYWRYEELESNDGTTVTLYIPAANESRKKAAINSIIQGIVTNNIYPVKLNGTDVPSLLDDFRPGKVPGAVVCRIDGDPEVHYRACFKKGNPEARDEHIAIFINGIRAESGSAYHILNSQNGFKCVSNCRGDVYVPGENILVLSAKAQPNSGRNSILRDGAYASIREAVQKARVEAILQFSNRHLEDCGKLMVEIVLANLYCQADNIQSYLRKELPAGKAYLAPLMELLVSYPAFIVFSGYSQKTASLRDLIGENRPQFYCYVNESAEAVFNHCHGARAIKNDYMLNFGLFRSNSADLRISDIVCPILESIGIDCYNAEYLMEDIGLQEKLKSRDLFEMRSIPVEIPDDASVEKFRPFRDKAEALMNMPAMLGLLASYGLGRVGHIKIHLVRLKEPVEKKKSVIAIAGLIEDLQNANENGKGPGLFSAAGAGVGLHIGVFVDSVFSGLMANYENFHLLFLGTICHEIAHYTLSVSGKTELRGHTRRFNTDRTKLETRVVDMVGQLLLGKLDTNGIKPDDMSNVIYL